MSFFKWLFKDAEIRSTREISDGTLVGDLRVTSQINKARKDSESYETYVKIREEFIQKVIEKSKEVAENGRFGFGITIHDYYDGYDYTELTIIELKKKGFTVTKCSEYGTLSYRISW